MKYETEVKNNVTIIRIKEERLDATVAPELKAQLLVHSKKGDSNVLIDLQDVDYSDSSGLGAILFGIRQYRASGMRIKLVNVQPRVLTLIRIAKLDEVVESFDDEDEALASY